MPQKQPLDGYSHNRGNPQNLNPEFPDLAQALSGVDLPQDKEGLRSYAEENGADDDVLSMIDGMPEQEYTTMADIMASAAGNPDAD